MADEQYQYPFDQNATVNWVPNERHTISPPDYMDHYFVVPLVGPFYAKDLKIIHYPSGKELIDGKDFTLGYKFVDASKALGKDVWGAICIYGRTLAGVLDISYRPLGGDWSINAEKAAELLANAISNPRITSWEQVVELPYKFPVIDHEWDLVDMVGASELVAAIDAIRLQLNESSGAEVTQHIADKNNPHEVTKSQIGLGLVQNFPMATAVEALEGERADRYISPRTLYTTVNSLALGPLNQHLGDMENPHNTTKAQVGLSNVDNFPTADEAVSLEGRSSTHFITPYGVRLLIGALISPELSDHVTTIGNPHRTNKEDIGLGNVPNYGMATEQQAYDGNTSAAFMSPLLTKLMIDRLALDPMRAHINERGNPHGLTAGDLNLDRVANYAPATEVDAAEATSDELYMTPYMTRIAIMELVGDHFESHLADRNNPHRVTKAQVGLSEVLNFGLASESDATTGEALEGYMTPYLTAAAIRSLAVTPLNAHKNDKNNPHQVTKAQVGLGNVQNFGVAGLTEAQLGESDELYMTPAATKVAIQTFAGNALTNHTSATNNPHQVTKAQVGLGLVDNFATASLAEAAQGEADNLFVTPAGVKAYVDANGGTGGGVDETVVQDLLSRIQTLSNELEEHRNDVLNPHQISLDALGGVTIGTVQGMLQNKLDVDGIAVDSYLLQGKSINEIYDDISLLIEDEIDNNYAVLQRSYKFTRPTSTAGKVWCMIGGVAGDSPDYYSEKVTPVTLLIQDFNGGLDHFTFDLYRDKITRVMLNGIESRIQLAMLPSTDIPDGKEIWALFDDDVSAFGMTILTRPEESQIVDIVSGDSITKITTDAAPTNAILPDDYHNPAYDTLRDELTRFVDELYEEI